MKIRIPRFIPFCAALLLTACSLQSTAPEKTFFQFGACRPADTQTPAQAGTSRLKVQDFRVPQINRSANLIYRESDQRFVADPYRLFTAPPGTLITERTRAWLADSNRFAAVVPAGSQLETDLTLEGELLEFHADVRAPRAPVAVINLRIRLIDKNGALQRPEWHFNQRITLKSADAASVAAGLDQGLSWALADLEKALEK
jgi:ABC-type uncharacterized transport system auxiliary subunit